MCSQTRGREERAPVQDLVIGRAELNQQARLNLGRFVCSQAGGGEKKERLCIQDLYKMG